MPNKALEARSFRASVDDFSHLLRRYHRVVVATKFAYAYLLSFRMLGELGYHLSEFCSRLARSDDFATVRAG
jgi:hypothetical protein